MKYTRSENTHICSTNIVCFAYFICFWNNQSNQNFVEKSDKILSYHAYVFFLQIIRYLVTQQKKCLILNEKTKNGTKLFSDINLYGQWYFIHDLSFRYKLTWIRNYRERYWQKLWRKQSLFGAWGHKESKQETKNEEGWRERGAYLKKKKTIF